MKTTEDRAAAMRANPETVRQFKNDCQALHRVPEGARPVEFSQRSIAITMTGAEWFALSVALIRGLGSDVMSETGLRTLSAAKVKLADQLTKEAGR